MTADQAREIHVVVRTSSALVSDTLESRVLVPRGADFADFIDALRDESPTVYQEVLRRVLRAAGRVLAYGRDDPLLMMIDRKLVEGGVLVFPAEEDEEVPADLTYTPSVT